MLSNILDQNKDHVQAEIKDLNKLEKPKLDSPVASHKIELESQKTLIGEQLLQMTNTRGNYQQLILLLAILMAISAGFAMILVSYAAPEPSFQCPDPNDPHLYTDCLEDKACKLIEQGGKAKVIFPPDSWTDKYQLGCGTKKERTVAMMVMIVIAGAGPLPSDYLTDLFGRKLGLFICFLYTVVGFGFSFFGNSYMLNMIGLGIWNAGGGIATVLFTIIITECTDQKSKLRGITVTTFFVGYSLGCITVNIFAYVSESADFLVLVCASLIAPAAFFSLISLSETPMYELDRRNVQNFEKIIEKIGRFNGRPLTRHLQYQEKISQIKEIIEAQEKTNCQSNSLKCEDKYPVIQLFLNKRHAITMAKLTIVSIFYFFVNIGMSVNVQGFGSKDIKLNGILFGLSQTLGSALVVPNSPTMKRKKALIIFQFIILLASGVLLLISLWFDLSNKSVQLCQSLVCAFIGAALNAFFPFLMLLVSESFPPQLRASANTVIFTVSNSLALFAPYCGDLAQNLGVHFVVGCSAIGLLSWPLTFTLEETLAEV